MYLNCKTIIEFHFIDCQKTLDEIESEFKIISENERYSEDIKSRLIYELRIRVERLDQKILDSIVEATDYLTRNHQANFNKMLQLTHYFENIRSEQSKKLMLPVTNKLNVSCSFKPFSFVSSYSSSSRHKDSHNDWKNTSGESSNQSKISEYAYSEMEQFFDHDFSLNFNDQDLNKSNLIVFILNQTNLKTFTNNRALIGSKKKDFISMVIINIIFIY